VAANNHKKFLLAAPPQIDADESRAAVALTVAWMLTLLSTAAAMIVAASAWLLMLAFPVAAGQGHPLASLPGTLTFVAAATGILCLILTYFVHRVRKSPAPRTITIAAVLIGAVPWATIAVLSFRS
jgi:hypothetical protein